MGLASTDAPLWSSALIQAVKWAVPDFYDKTPFDQHNMWSIPAPLPLIVLQIHLLLRYNPKATWLLRASLAPIITLLALRFSFAHYYTVTGAAQLEGRGQHVNIALGCGGACIVVWAWGWGLTLRRPKLKFGTGYTNGVEKSSNKIKSRRTRPAENDLPTFFPGTYVPLELDLLINLRGIGWEHGISQGAPALPVPKVTRQERWSWIVRNLLPCVWYYLLYDAIFVLIEDTRFNVHAHTPRGGSIWDCTDGAFGVAGPYLICLAYASTFVCVQYMSHAVMGAFAIGLFNDIPSRWDPPGVKCPWISTSVRDFWSNRWHQYLRISFMTLGFWPVKAVVEPIAGKRVATYVAVVGAFAASGIIHDVGRVALAPSPGWGITEVSLFFAIQPVAIFCEQLWEHFTGRKVKGVLGWLWTLSWMLATSPWLFEVRRSLFFQSRFLQISCKHVCGVPNRFITLTRLPLCFISNPGRQ